jgi:hypothetical protein
MSEQDLRQPDPREYVDTYTTVDTIPLEKRPDWVLTAFARLGYARNKIPPEEVKHVQNFLNRFSL